MIILDLLTLNELDIAVTDSEALYDAMGCTQLRKEHIPAIRSIVRLRRDVLPRLCSLSWADSNGEIMFEAMQAEGLKVKSERSPHGYMFLVVEGQ